MTIILRGIYSIEDFCETLNECTGDVELVTEDGDVLNLKSTLSQLLSIATILPEVTELSENKLIIEKTEDAEMIKSTIIGEVIDKEDGL